MRTVAPALLPVFRSRLQGELLALILTDPGMEWTVDQLAERTGQPYQTVANEVRRLQAADLVASRPVGRSKLLRANEDSPYFRPLAQLVLMSFGPPLIIEEEFGALELVQQVFIFGSWAARYAGESGPAPHDVDVLLVGAPDRDAAYDAARRAEQRLGREVNVTIRSVEQWHSRADGFTRQLRSSPLLEIPLHAQNHQHDPDGVVSRWAKGAERVTALIEARHLQRVIGDPDIVGALLASARRHVESARLAVSQDPEAAYSLAYDAARKSATTLLNHQGLRPTTAGGHLAVVDTVSAQFPGVPGLASLDRLRRRRNQAEYPDPRGYDPITSEEANDAIRVAGDCVSSAERLLKLDEIGVF